MSVPATIQTEDLRHTSNRDSSLD